jgi:hypothetical protein
MEPLYDGRASLKVGDTVRGSRGGDYRGPAFTSPLVGPVPPLPLHPYERGWLVQLGRARGRVSNKYLGDMIFRARTIVAMQPGTTLVSFPEPNDDCLLSITIGAGPSGRVLSLPRTMRASWRRSRGRPSPLSVWSCRTLIAGFFAVAYEHLLKGRPAPVNVAAVAASRLGISEQAVKNVITKTRKRVNDERCLNLDTSDQLGHYLVHLSRNLTWQDFPPQLADGQGLPG